MTRNRIEPRQLEFAEEMGILMEQTGHPRIAGKILGLLLITSEAKTSGEDLARRLKASKGSVSTMTRFLIQLGLVEKVGVPGERRDYFKVRAGSFSSLLHARLAQVRDYRLILEKGLNIVSGEHTEASERLRRFHEFYEFFEKEFSTMLSQWEMRHSNE